jgi:hypothetical protein
MAKQKQPPKRTKKTNEELTRKSKHEQGAKKQAQDSEEV